ncbi:S1C family serine protease [Pseudomonas viridiflava]|uniref:S1C family serine protease n=1 Tax=Pseudomonas viridiflava TaxID=33069 RepID=UPI001F12207F|nr:serine protease [Pseudomonas viridiflava]
MVATAGEPNFKLLGSGFICSSKGYFLTSAHLLDLTKPVFIALPPDSQAFPKMHGNKFQFIPAQIVQYDPVNDVALLRVNSAEITIAYPTPSLVLGDERSVDIGSSVGYLGFPFGLNIPKVSQSVISAKISNESGTRNLMLDTSINDKNSGGPLIDVESGRVIGIVSGRFSPGGTQTVAWIAGQPMGQDSNISFATGISYAIELLKAENVYE